MSRAANALLAYIQSEMVKGRLTAVQAEVITRMVRDVEAECQRQIEEL